MKQRFKRKDTTLFFDSFKHLKNNVSILISAELITIMNCSSVKQYLELKSVNYKSKYPDMRKLGLIDYNVPRDNKFDLTESGAAIYEYFKDKGYNYSENYEHKRLTAIDPYELLNLLDTEEKVGLINEVLKLLISYYDSADCIRPYLALIKFVEKNNIKKLDGKTLYNILSHPKDKILLKEYTNGLYNTLDSNIQDELRRPVTYIINALQVAGIINEECKIIYNRELVEKIIFDMDEVVIENEAQEGKGTKTRIAKEQTGFRREVLAAYEYKCAITGKCIVINNGSEKQYLLDAAHIIPYSESGSFSVNNGIALSYDMHKLFDRGLFTFVYKNENELIIKVTESKNILDDGILEKLNGKIVRLPKDNNKYPDNLGLIYRYKKHLIA